MAQSLPMRLGARGCGVGLSRRQDVAARYTILDRLVPRQLLEAIVEVRTLVLGHCLYLLGGTPELL